MVATVHFSRETDIKYDTEQKGKVNSLPGLHFTLFCIVNRPLAHQVLVWKFSLPFNIFPSFKHGSSIINEPS